MVNSVRELRMTTRRSPALMIILRHIEHEVASDRIAPVYRPEDIRKNAEAGKISGMLTIEEAGCCKGSLGVLRRMYELGVRPRRNTMVYFCGFVTSFFVHARM